MRIVKNIAANYTLRLGSTLLALVQVKILSLGLAKASLGLYFGTAGTALFLLEFLKMGMPLVLPRFVPLYEARGEPEQARALEGLVFTAYAGLVLLVALLAWLVARALPGRAFWQLLPVALLAFGVQAWNQLQSTALVAHRRVTTAAWVFLLGQTLFTVLLFGIRHALTLHRVYGLAALSFLMSSGLALSLLRPGHPLRFRPDPELSRFVRFAVYHTFFAPVFHYFDYVVLSFASTWGSLALFGLARRVEEFLKKLLWIPLEVLAPEISLRDGARRQGHHLANRVIRLYWLLSLALAVPAFLFRNELVVLISRSQYAGAGLYLAVLVLHVVLLGWAAPLGVAARSLGDMKLLFLADALRNGAYVPLALLFTWQWGPMGLAASFVLSTGLSLGFLMARSRTIGLRLPGPRDVAPGLFFALLALAAGLGVHRLLGVVLTLLVLVPWSAEDRESWQTLIRRRHE